MSLVQRLPTMACPLRKRRQRQRVRRVELPVFESACADGIDELGTRCKRWEGSPLHDTMLQPADENASSPAVLGADSKSGPSCILLTWFSRAKAHWHTCQGHWNRLRSSIAHQGKHKHKHSEHGACAVDGALSHRWRDGVRYLVWGWRRYWTCHLRGASHLNMRRTIVTRFRVLIQLLHSC